MKFSAGEVLVIGHTIDNRKRIENLLKEVSEYIYLVTDLEVVTIGDVYDFRKEAEREKKLVVLFPLMNRHAMQEKISYHSFPNRVHLDIAHYAIGCNELEQKIIKDRNGHPRDFDLNELRFLLLFMEDGVA